MAKKEKINLDLFVFNITWKYVAESEERLSTFTISKSLLTSLITKDVDKLQVGDDLSVDDISSIRNSVDNSTLFGDNIPYGNSVGILKFTLTKISNAFSYWVLSRCFTINSESDVRSKKTTKPRTFRIFWYIDDGEYKSMTYINFITADSNLKLLGLDKCPSEYNDSNGVAEGVFDENCRPFPFTREFCKKVNPEYIVGRKMTENEKKEFVIMAVSENVNDISTDRDASSLAYLSVPNYINSTGKMCMRKDVGDKEFHTMDYDHCDSNEVYNRIVSILSKPAPLGKTYVDLFNDFKIPVHKRTYMASFENKGDEKAVYIVSNSFGDTYFYWDGRAETYTEITSIRNNFLGNIGVLQGSTAVDPMLNPDAAIFICDFGQEGYDALYNQITSKLKRIVEKVSKVNTIEHHGIEYVIDVKRELYSTVKTIRYIVESFTKEQGWIIKDIVVSGSLKGDENHSTLISGQITYIIDLD